MNSHDNTSRFDAEILLREGQQFQDHHAFGKALEAYRQAATLQPDRGVIHFSMGVVLAKLGKWAEAGTGYREAIRLRPNDTEAHLNLGFVYYELGLDTEAQNEFEHAKTLGGLAKPAGKMRF